MELKMSRDALEQILKQRLFGRPDGRFYLKGDAQSVCPVYVEQPELRFDGERVVVRVKVQAKLGKAIAGKCIGISLSPTAELSVVPDAEGETIGFRDARVERVSDSKELNFLLMPFLHDKIPSSLKLNAADMLRRTLDGFALKIGYKVALDRLQIHSMAIQDDALVVNLDGDLSVK